MASEVKSSAHQINFNNYLVEFITKLRELIPSEERLFNKYYKYYRSFVDRGQRIEFIVEFVKYLATYNKEVSLKDEGLFSEEQVYYPSKPIQLLKGIDFKRFWSQPQITTESKESIWKYLQTLYIIGTYVLKETNRYNEVLKKQEEIINRLVESLKYEKQIKEEAEKQAKEEDKGASGIFDFFDENNIIMQIAKETIKENNLSSELSNDPMQAIKLLLDNDGSKLQHIMSIVSTKLTTKLKEQGSNSDLLYDQAKQFGEKLIKNISGIPGMSGFEKMYNTFLGEFKTALSKPTPPPTTDGTQDSSVSAAASSSSAPAHVPEPPSESKENLDRCASMITQLKEELKQNMSQLDLGYLEEFATTCLNKVEKIVDPSDLTGTQGLPQVPRVSHGPIIEVIDTPPEKEASKVTSESKHPQEDPNSKSKKGRKKK